MVSNFTPSPGEALRTLIQESDRLIMVYYTAPDCYACYHLGPILDRLAAAAPRPLHALTIDITAHPDLAQVAQVTGTPTVQFFKHQTLLLELRGLKPKSEYRAAIESYA